jgi:hypothetical protein
LNQKFKAQSNETPLSRATSFARRELTFLTHPRLSPSHIDDAKERREGKKGNETPKMQADKKGKNQ